MGTTYIGHLYRAALCQDEHVNVVTVPLDSICRKKRSDLVSAEFAFDGTRSSELQEEEFALLGFFSFCMGARKAGTNLLCELLQNEYSP